MADTSLDSRKVAAILTFSVFAFFVGIITAAEIVSDLLDVANLLDLAERVCG